MVKKVAHDKYHGWDIEIAERSVGVTVKRKQFSATLRDAGTKMEDYLAGFSSLHAAMAAAHERIDFKAEQIRLRADQPHGRWKPPKPKARKK